MAGGCGCTTDCPIATMIRLTPGGTYTAEWPGLLLSPAELPAVCSSQDCGTSCSLAHVPVPGPHDFTLGLVEAPDCDTVDCTCVPNADGWCDAGGWGEDTGQAYVVAADLPSDSVTLAVQ